MTSHGLVNFNKFAETTSFVGIIQAHRGSLTGKVFWAVLLVGTFSVTLYSVVNLVCEFNAEQTVTNSFIRNNDTITLPDPAICLSFYALDLWEIVERLHLNNTSIVRNYLQYLQNQIGTKDAISWIEANAFNSTLRKRVQMQSFITLSAIMFLSLSVTETKAASRMLEDEEYFNKMADSLNFTWSISMDRSGKNHKELHTSVAEVRNFISKNVGNWMKVREIVALAWMMNADVELYRAHGKVTSEKIHSGKPKLTWFGTVSFIQSFYSLDFRICFRIANAETFFTFGLLHGFWVDIRSTSDRQTLPFRAIEMMFSKDRGPTVTNLVLNTVRFDRDVGTNFFIAFDSRYEAKNLRKKPCLTDTTQFDCKMHCQSKFLQQHCGCMPLSFQWDAPQDEVRFCGLATLSADASVYTNDYSLPHLRRLQNVSKHLLDCFDSCAQDCVTTILNYGSTTLELENGLRELSMQTMAYTELESKKRMSSSDFFANLGGILGLWNGACMLSYVHGVMWILQWVFYRYLKRPRVVEMSHTSKNEQPSANSSVSMHVTEFVETTGFMGIAHAYDGKKFQRIVWIVLLIGSQCLTLYYVANQASYYLTRNVASSVSIKHNYGMDLPAPTFCLFPEMENIMHYANQFELTNRSQIQTALRQYDNVDVSNLLLRNARNESFITKHATFIVLATIVFLRSAYIESAVSSALLFRSNRTVVNYLSEFNGCYTAGVPRKLTDNICNSTILVKDYIVDHSIDLVQLRNTLTYIWWSQLNVTFNRPGETGLLQITNASQIRTSWFGYEPMYYEDSYYRICFQLNDKQAYVKLTDNSDYIAATSKPMAPFCNTNFPVIPTISLVFTTGRTELYSSMLSSINFNIDDDQNYLITYVQTYSALSTAERPCSTSATRLDLTGACVAQFFVENCNCFPFSWLWDGVLANHARTPLCGFMATGNLMNSFLEPALQQCLTKLIGNYGKLQICISDCPSECESSNFEVTPQNGDRITQEASYHTNAHQFITIIEQVDKSMVDFIADLGGIIGVWNGAVAMTYIHIIVFLVKWLANYWGHRGLQTSTSNIPKITFNEGVGAQSVKEFVKTTSFAGVMYAYQSRVKVELVFWSALLCLFFGFTIQNICQQVQQYQAQDTLTEMTVTSSSKITLPNPFICLSTKMEYLSRTVNDSRQYIDLTDMKTVDRMLTLLNNINVTQWLISGAKNTLERKAFLLLATCVLFDLATNEKILGSSLKMPSWSSVCSKDTKGIILSLAKTKSFLKSKKLDFIGFRHALTARWVKEMQIGIIASPDAAPALFSHDDFETTWFGPHPFQIVEDAGSLSFRICFRLHDGYRLSTFASDQDAWSWLSYSFNFNYSLISSQVLTSIALTFTNARAYSSEAMATATARVSTVHGGGYYVAVEKKFAFMNLTKNRCKSEGKNVDCKLSCISSLIRKYCGCVSLNYLWDNVDPSEEGEQMPLCALNETLTTASCRLRFPKTATDAITTCQQRCPRDCTVTTVRVYPDPVENRYPYRMNIKAASFRYVELNEGLRMTGMDFWNNIGGILGVWTGACLLSYVHAVAFIVNLIWLKFGQYNQIRKKYYADDKSRFYLQ